jgi:hypothetical protein
VRLTCLQIWFDRNLCTKRLAGCPSLTALIQTSFANVGLKLCLRDFVRAPPLDDSIGPNTVNLETYPAYLHWAASRQTIRDQGRSFGYSRLGVVLIVSDLSGQFHHREILPLRVTFFRIIISRKRSTIRIVLLKRGLHLDRLHPLPVNSPESQ